MRLRDDEYPDCVLFPCVLGLVLAQVPATAALPTGTQPSTLTERDLGKAFRLKSEHFLTWHGVYRPTIGWTAIPVEVRRVEISPTASSLSKFALSFESISADENAPVLNARLEYLISDKQRVGVDLLTLVTAATATLRSFVPATRVASPRPGFLMRGRF